MVEIKYQPIKEIVVHEIIKYSLDDFLKQYYRDPPEIRAKKYKELEPSLLIESYKLEVDNTKDKLIDELQDKMQKLQDKMTRIELLNKS